MVYPKFHGGFRSEPSMIDMVFSLRQLQDIDQEHRQLLSIASSTSQNHLILWARIGCPQRHINIAQSFHVNMKDIVQFGDSYSEAFSIRSGVEKGLCACTYLTQHLFRGHSEIWFRGFNWNRRRRQEQTESKVRDVFIRDMLFANDASVWRRPT